MSITYFDGHCDTIYRCYETGQSLRENGGRIDLLRGSRLGRYAQVFAMFYDPCDGMRRHLDGLHETYLREMEANRDLVTHCSTAADVEKAWSEGKMAALMSIEGADLMDCDPENIGPVRSWGTRLINITWSVANRLSGCCAQEQERGLSALGREFVREAQANGIYMDVSHLSERGFWDLVDITDAPIVASHSNSSAVFPHARGLTDAQAREIASTGGVIGFNFCGEFIREKPTMEDAIRHIEHLMDICGEDTVAMGGDLDGCDSMFEGLYGVQDVPNFYNAIKARGYSQELMDKLFWRNWLRLM